MSVPSTVFIDTGIYERACFNFESAQFQIFNDAFENKKLTLLEPDPISREVRRHIRERISEVARAIDQVEKKMPCLRRLEKWPTEGWKRHHDVQSILQGDFDRFCNQFERVRLGYDGVSIQTLMNWYNWGKPPFGSGKKRKEFPDALAVAILDHYAISNGKSVAVISTDDDLERACAERPHLCFFPSLGKFVEVNQGHQERVRAVDEWVESQPEELWSTIEGDLVSTKMTLERDYFSAEIEEEEFSEISVGEIVYHNWYVIAIADRECTVAIDLTAGIEGSVMYKERVEEGYYDERRDEIYEKIVLVDKQKDFTEDVDTTATVVVRLDSERRNVEVITHSALNIKDIVIEFDKCDDVFL